jgi:glucose/mannose-6-phosphate isomerase
MEEVIKGLPDQIAHAYQLAESAGIKARTGEYSAVYIAGMGGSAIAGDILEDYVSSHIKVPLQVIRGYDLKGHPEGKILFVFLSYSGNTEETLSLLDQAEGLNADIFMITTGGKLKARAVTRGYPVLVIPDGYPPRGALGYSFISLLYMLSSFYPEVDVERDVSRTVDLLRGLVPSYYSAGNNSPPYVLAEKIQGKLPVIYTSAGLESVALRWKGQFSENAKVLACMGVIPEMNHNEICGWQNNPEVLRSIHVIFLRDEGEHPRICVRMGVTRELIEPFASGVTEVKSVGKSLLERIFSLIYMGDFVSFFLSNFLDTDPMPVEKINILKDRLEQSR